MATDKHLRDEIERLFYDRQRKWKKQGRDGSHFWAVENFRTGQGQLFFDDVIALIERETAAKDAALERARAEIVEADSRLWYVLSMNEIGCDHCKEFIAEAAGHTYKALKKITPYLPK